MEWEISGMEVRKITLHYTWGYFEWFLRKFLNFFLINHTAYLLIILSNPGVGDMENRSEGDASKSGEAERHKPLYLLRDIFSTVFSLKREKNQKNNHTSSQPHYISTNPRHWMVRSRLEDGKVKDKR